MSRLAPLICLLTVSVLASAALAQGPQADLDTWPTLHRDNVRSGYFPELVRGPYERKWFRDFHDEMIATRVEAIVAEGKVFVPTFAGNVYALDVTNGETEWSAEFAGPIGHSPLYMDGRLYVASQGGQLVCLDAADGSTLWSYDAGAGIWVHPASDGERIYFGDRDGVFHAVNLDGSCAWTVETGYMILTPASIAPGGQVVFASEDMHVYCLSADGDLLWRSEKLGGLSLRDHAPTIWQGLVLVRTNPAAGFHGAFGMHGETFKNFHMSLPMAEDDEILFDQWGGFAMRPTDRRAAAEMQWARDYLAEHPYEQTFYAFDLEDGTEPWVSPVLYNAGLHNPATPPTFNPETNELYVWGGTGLSNFHRGVPGGFVHVLNVDPQTGDIHHIRFSEDTGVTGGAFAQPSDETFALSLMDGLLINTHMGSVLGMRLEDLSFQPIYGGRDTYGGVYGRETALRIDEGEGGGFYGPMRRAHNRGFLVQMQNEWHGPDRSIVAIAQDRLFWVVGSQVVCLGGAEAERTETGGRSLFSEPIRRAWTPVTPGGNVGVDFGEGFDQTVRAPEITPAQVRSYLTPGDAQTACDDDARAQLDALVAETVSADWAPWAVELGISGVEVQFARSAETMQALALALPYVSDDVRAEAIAALDAMWADGVPLTRRAAEGDRRREYYTPGDGMLSSQPALADNLVDAAAPIEDLYAVWAYAHYGDRWEAVLAEADAIRHAYSNSTRVMGSFSHADSENRNASEHLNRQIAGALAYARIMDRAGDRAATNQALVVVAGLLTQRVHHERADHQFVRTTRFTGGLTSHAARLPRYVGLTPEVGAMLAEFAGEAIQTNLRNVARDLPVWYMTWGERLIGGENYISPPSLACGMYTAFAWTDVADEAELRLWLDEPWVRADLYQIEKLVAMLGR